MTLDCLQSIVVILLSLNRSPVSNPREIRAELLLALVMQPQVVVLHRYKTNSVA